MELTSIKQLTETEIVKPNYVYEISKGEQSILRRGLYSGKVLTGQIQIGMVTFTEKFNISFKEDKLIEALEDSHIFFTQCPVVPQLVDVTSLPEPPDVENPLERLIENVLIERGLVDPHDRQTSKFTTQDMDYDDELDYEEFDEGDTPLDNYSEIPQEDLEYQEATTEVDEEIKSHLQLEAEVTNGDEDTITDDTVTDPTTQAGLPEPEPSNIK